MPDKTASERDNAPQLATTRSMDSDDLNTSVRYRLAGVGSIATFALALWTLGCSAQASSGSGDGGARVVMGGASGLNSSEKTAVSEGGKVGGSQVTNVKTFGGSSSAGGRSSGIGGWQTGAAQSGGVEMGSTQSAGSKSNAGGRVSSGGATGQGGTTTTRGKGATAGTASKGGAVSVVGGATAAGGTSASGGTPPITTTTAGPCDIYKAGNTACVAAFSTVRAL